MQTIKSRKVMADCLKTPLILREIFQNFSSTELLQLSLVNKQWNYEARSLMRNRGNLSANINKNSTCQDLKALASDLRRMKEMKKIIPFTGMSIALKGFHWGQRMYCKHYSPTGELDKDYEDLLEQMTWKNLSVSFDWTGDKCQDCTAYMLVEKVFKKYCLVLQELSVQLEFNNRDFISFVLPGCSFPSLKTFKIQKVNPKGAFPERHTDLIKKMISISPNLKVLHTEDRVNLQANLLEGSSAVHVTDYEHYCSYLHEIPESVLGELRIQRMRLESISQQLNIESFNGMASTLLLNSRTTLSSMEIPAIFLVPLKRYRICLSNVRKLCLRFTVANLESQPRSGRLVKSFDFTRTFPILSGIHISWMSSSDYKLMFNALSHMFEQENAAFIEPTPDRAGNIKNLSLQWPTDILEYPMEFLTQMFPDVQKLSIQAERVSFTRIWESWRDLEELDITLRGLWGRQKFDGAFCGISCEEAAQLRRQTDKYLEEVHIVPVRPSITCMKGLRTLNLSFEETDSICRRQFDHPAFVFSKVTAFIAFQRYPQVAKTLTMTDGRLARALSRLAPFASIVLEEHASG